VAKNLFRILIPDDLSAIAERNAFATRFRTPGHARGHHVITQTH
jgi:hypothetical protein